MRQKDNRVLLHIVEMAQEGVHLPKVALDSPKKKKKKKNYAWNYIIWLK